MTGLSHDAEKQMKRSQINTAIENATAFFSGMNFPLPPFAHWTPEEWKEKGHDRDEIRECRLGWDVTDFSSGDFECVGRTIFTLRNGLKASPHRSKTYAQKAMMLREDQKSPVHYHLSKMEDIINQGGGNILIVLWNATPDNKLSDAPVKAAVDGRAITVKPGEPIRLEPGESVCLVPRTYHQFWAERGAGATLSIEVSSVCDDFSDNFFLKKMKRFPPIEEDEPIRHYLCNEYPTAPDSPA
jgi:D-lyxose ketol-isomerase